MTTIFCISRVLTSPPTPFSFPRRYAEITSEVLTTVNKTEASLLRLRKTRKKKEGGAVAVGTDEDKIRRQLFLDAELYGAQVCAGATTVEWVACAVFHAQPPQPL